MRSLSLLILGILLLNISCTATDMKVILKTDNSNIETIVPSKSDSEELISLLKELIQKTDDMLKVYLGPERIENMKQDEQYVEFLFESKIKVNSTTFGDYDINKILVPLTGTFGISNSSQKTTIILGNEDGYISGPLRNADGYKIVQKLKSILERSKNK